MFDNIKIILPPRDSDFLSESLRLLTQKICESHPELEGGYGLGGKYGYGKDFENDIFVMRRFYWGDCDCGADERRETWHNAHPHAEDCFRQELHRRFDAYDAESGYNAIEAARAAGEFAHEAWCKAHDARSEAHRRLTAELYDERGLPRSPYQWHCTCGVDDLAKSYFATEGHYPTCAFALPNFRHKRTGFEVRWYKWIGRDNELKNEPDDVADVISECIRSLSRAQD